MPIPVVAKKNGKVGVRIEGNFFDRKIDAFVWLAYTEKPFWNALWRNKKHSKKLRKVLESRGFKSPPKSGKGKKLPKNAVVVTETDIQRLKKSLNRRFVYHVHPQKLMTDLHTYTRPKKHIDASWAEW